MMEVGGGGVEGVASSTEVAMIDESIVLNCG